MRPGGSTDGVGVRLRRLFPLVALLTFGGCLGPEAIRQTRGRYNDAYRTTNDEQLLLNIVRLRYADSPVFVDLTNITSQFEGTATAGYAGGLDGQGPGHTQLGRFELLLRDAPTLSYHPREGHEIARALITPMTAELVRLVSPGTNSSQFLMMAVSDANDVPNAPLATSLAPRVPDDNSRFRQGIALLTALEEQGLVEFSYIALDTDTFDPIPLEQVRGRDALEAVQEGYVFRTDSGQAVLRRHEKVVVLKVRPDAVNSPTMLEFARAFHLEPGRPYYKVKSEQNEEEKTDELPEALGNDELLLNMRSIYETLTFLSKGVCIPPRHVEQGVAPSTPGAGGCPYDWTRVTAGLFQVRSSKHRPHDAEVAVFYRDYWFYIAPDDVASRSALAILEILFALQESEGAQAGPLLTLPIN